MDCGDENPCTLNECDPQMGCMSSPINDEPCDDGSVCTAGDMCEVGVCVGGPDVLECDDDDPCTSDQCHPVDGCVHGPITGASCDDGDVCTVGDQCVDGECTSGQDELNCDDGNACTEDICEYDDGCWNGLIVSNACLPNIVVDYPPRAAGVLRNDASETTIAVTGTVSSGAGDITSLTLNGTDVPVGIDGQFTVNYAPANGGNTLEFVATDSMDATNNRVQSFHWSHNFLFPEDKTEYGPASKCFETTFETGCFHVLEETGISWTAAEAACAAWGGNLTSIHSSEENDFVQELAKNSCNQPAFWIGLSDQQEEGTFVWSDGTAVEDVFWNSGEPNNAGGDEDFVEMKADGTWNDVGANKAVSCFVCRKPYEEPQYVFTGHVDPGAALYLGQSVLDDGDHSLPVDDMATIFEQVFAGFDVGGLIPTPAAENVEASGATYDIYISNLTYDPPEVSLTAVTGGLQVIAVINNGEADLKAKKKSGIFLAPGELNGTLYLDMITITALLEISVDENNELSVEIGENSVDIDGVSVDIESWLSGILNPIINGVIGDFVGDIEEQFSGELNSVLGPMLVDALSALAFTFDFDLPSLNPEAPPVHVRVNTDFVQTIFDPEGGLIVLRTLATSDEVTTPYNSLGAPTRNGCGVDPHVLQVLKQSPMEVVLTDDTMNLILFAAWQGGFTEFEVPESLFGEVDLSSFGVTDLTATVSGMLAPAISDCQPDGQLSLHMGDIRLDASLTFAGEPMTLTVYASLKAAFDLSAGPEGVSFGISELQEVKTEINVLEDKMVQYEPLLGALIENQVLPSLLEELSGDQLGSIPLPSIDLGASLDMGVEALITIEPSGVERVNGNTIIGADLAAGGP